KGLFYGTTHTYLGQEANAAGVLANLEAQDIVVSNHRCHGHFLAYGGSPQALFAELMGRPDGVCGGRGGSQHLHWRNFYSNGVQGGIAPLAVGMALAEKLKGSQAAAVVFLGDGTLGEGAVYEALNLAALWGAPALFVVEDNRIAQTTPVEQALAGSLAARFAAFGIPVEELDSSDVCQIQPLAGRLLDEARREQAPRALVLHTCRFGPHSKGDDTRPPELVEELKRWRDPLTIHATRLAPGEQAAIEAEAAAEIQTAFAAACASPPHPTIPPGSVPAARAHPTPAAHSSKPAPPQAGAGAKSVLAALNQGLQRAMQADPAVLLLGEDLLDPYGGAFKVSRGLSSAFPGRVWNTPISEGGFTGAATGMALRGLRPVVEIMFGDFITLAADQLINHAAKFGWMFSGGRSEAQRVCVPLVVRAPMGGRRGYGPTHSQTLEKHFLGVPGLRVLAPTALCDAGALLEQAILHTEEPVLFVENKLLYLLPPLDPATLDEFMVETLDEAPGAPAYRLQVRGAPPAQLTLAAYGYMGELARQAQLRLAYEHEVFVELICPTQLAPFACQALLDSAARTGRLVTVEEGAGELGWGAELTARAVERLPGRLHAARLTAANTPVPSSGPLEAAALPSVEEIMTICLQIVQNR
ncbi:MAG: dehydrogenase E1 component subunit alpha/beta, partial [Chloroflexota bacterium]